MKYLIMFFLLAALAAAILAVWVPASWIQLAITAVIFILAAAVAAASENAKGIKK